jgi:phospholipid/cholesterol/gamma-HCH transport system substrate-binding protein
VPDRKDWDVKKTDMDLFVGASILISVVILITGVLWLKDVSLSRKMVDYAVLFPNVGTLQVGDPVMVNGVSKGTVKQIYLRNSSVAVILEMDKSVQLTDSCRIMIQNIGLMGERGVGLHYSESGSAIHPINAADTLFLHGSFDTGIAEAMGMLGSVLEEVRELVGNVSVIVEQTVGDTSFLSLFRTISGRLDTISSVAQRIMIDNKAPLEKSVRNLQKLSEEARLLVDRNSPGIDTIVTNGKAITSRVLDITNSVDSLIVTVRSVVGRVEDEESTTGMLLRDKDLYNDLKKTVADLDTLIKNVQDDALKLRIKIGFGSKRK